MKIPRIDALDAFRGMTIAGMLLVNNPGTWSAIYPPLEHAPWHGWTPTDMVFPFFLFVVGVSIPLALGPALERDASGLPVRVLRRAATNDPQRMHSAAVPGTRPSTVWTRPQVSQETTDWWAIRLAVQEAYPPACPLGSP